MRDFLAFALPMVLLAVLLWSLFRFVPSNGESETEAASSPDIGSPKSRIFWQAAVLSVLCGITLLGFFKLVAGLMDGRISLFAVALLVPACLMVRAVSSGMKQLHAMATPWSSRPATEEEVAIFEPTSTELATHQFLLDAVVWVRRGDAAQEQLTAVFTNGSGAFAIQTAEKGKRWPLGITSFFDFERERPQLALSTSLITHDALTERLVVNVVQGSVTEVVQWHYENTRVLTSSGHGLIVDKPFWYLDEVFTHSELERDNGWALALRGLFGSRAHIVPVADRDL